MKKFTEAITIVRELNEKELSELQKSYRDYFGAKMKKFGVKSPAELDDAQKKEFFNEITKDWEKGKGATEAGKKDVEENSVKESEELNEAGFSDSAEKLADFLKKGESHFAAFLKPKKMNVELSGNVVTLTPASKSFTITADYDKKTLIATAKPAYPESVSYVEILESFKHHTGFLVTNESEEVNEGEINYQTDKYALVLVGGSIGSKQSYPLFVGGSMGSIVETSNDKDALVETKKRMNKQLSPGEKSYYGMSYKVAELTSNKIKEIDMLISKQSSSEDTIIEESEEITKLVLNEKDIKTAAEFKDFAEDKLKKAFGDDYDEAKAKKVIDGLSAEAEKSGDWGAAIGKLNKA